jgi:hypothetical protein
VAVNRLVHYFTMETLLEIPVRKKRGPVKRLPDMIGTKVYLESEMVDWAKEQPEGLSSLVRRLLNDEKARQKRRPR